MTSDEVWVLGATGRTGRAIAARLHETGVPLVLVGRDRGRLDRLAADLGGVPRVLAGTLATTLQGLAADAPGVVVNTVGPFTETAVEVLRACPPGTHYVDLANELAAAEQLFALDRQAAAAGQVVVTGAGFGVLGTESVVLRLCADRPRPARVRVDALPAVALEAGTVGTALAATIAEVLAFGGREVRGGRLVRAATAGHRVSLTTPDGHAFTTGSGANAELLAAWRASGADSVIAASTAAPSNAVLRFVLPALSALFRVPLVRRLAISRIARIRLRSQPMARASSWAHARVEWSSGEVRDGWLRIGDATDFTAAAAVEVTRRLLRGEGRPGAHTPGALFGPGLAEAVGAEFVLEPEGVGTDHVG